MSRTLRWLCAVLLCGFVWLPLQTAAQSESPQVSLVTFAPGQIYWQRFGHNALLVREPGRVPLLYNYGVFDFQQKNFFLNFARGRMLYRLDVAPLHEALYPYAREGRWALEQSLALSDAQARTLAGFLRENAQPENAEYRYDYFIDNCSTRVRDALNRVLSDALRQQLEAQPTGRSLRFEATRLISPDRALALGMDLGMGPPADAELNRWQQSFVPMVLMEALRGVRQGETPLVAQERWLLQAPAVNVPAAPTNLTGWFAAIGLVLAAASVLLPGFAGRGFGFLFTLVLGLSGLILALGWGLTEHWIMQGNRNLLLLNPLWLLLAPALLRQRPASRRARALAALICMGALAISAWALLPFSLQPQTQWIALLLPLNLALGWRSLRPASRS